jgi:hypothetical protein
MALKVQRIMYEDSTVTPEEVMTVREAAEVLGVSLPALNQLMNRGPLTVLIETEEPNWTRARRLLRVEVAELAETRGRSSVG